MNRTLRLCTSTLLVVGVVWGWSLLAKSRTESMLQASSGAVPETAAPVLVASEPDPRPELIVATNPKPKSIPQPSTIPAAPYIPGPQVTDPFSSSTESPQPLLPPIDGFSPRPSPAYNAAPPLPTGMVRKVIKVRVPTQVRDRNGVRIEYREVESVVMVPGHDPSLAIPDDAGSEDTPADALSVTRTDRLAQLRAAFEQKIELMDAQEMDAELAHLQRDIRELQAQTQMRQIRQQLAALQQQLSETAPAHAAVQMLSVPVPQIIESRNWGNIGAPLPSTGPAFFPQSRGTIPTY